ncbi:MAG: hypothetical protein WBX38_05085 [Candidatus Sulfotelmatobacter sp.]
MVSASSSAIVLLGASEIFSRSSIILFLRPDEQTPGFLTRKLGLLHGLKKYTFRIFQICCPIVKRRLIGGCLQRAICGKQKDALLLDFLARQGKKGGCGIHLPRLFGGKL